MICVSPFAAAPTASSTSTVESQEKSKTQQFKDRLPISFPSQEFCIHFPYQSEQELNGVIELAAERIAAIFSNFLTYNYHLRQNEYYTGWRPHPRKETINNFRMHLKETILKKLNNNEGSLRYARIETDLFSNPVGVLSELSVALNISEPSTLFPENIAAVVTIWGRKLRVAFVQNPPISIKYYSRLIPIFK